LKKGKETMLNEPTTEKLKTLRLEGMFTAWQEQQANPSTSALGFDERFGMLVDAEWTHRDNKRMKRSLREAKLRFTQACIEGIDYPARRELDKAVIRQLATCRWVQEHQAVLITGATGTGKRGDRYKSLAASVKPPSQVGVQTFKSLGPASHFQERETHVHRYGVRGPGYRGHPHCGRTIKSHSGSSSEQAPTGSSSVSNRDGSDVVV
jgi:hypothetical protein